MTPSLISSPKHRVRIAPHLTLTADHFEAAAAGIAEHSPHIGPLRWADFITPRHWTLVPDELTGAPYKAEMTLVKCTAQTVKLNCWLAPDRRAGAIPKLHNHPWDFTSLTLRGLLVEDRAELVDGTIVRTKGVEHGVGTLNRVGRGDFHEIDDLEPDTLTLMMCGPGMSEWGYIDVDDQYTRAELPAGFAQRLRELNPHQR